MKNLREKISDVLVKRVFALATARKPSKEHLAELKTYFGMMIDDEGVRLGFRKQVLTEQKEMPQEAPPTLEEVRHAIAVAFGKEYIN